MTLSSTLPRLRGPFLVLGGVWVLGLLLALRRLDPLAFQRLIAVHLILANLLAAGVLGLRARAERGGSRGWTLLAGSQVAALGYSLLLALVPDAARVTGALRGLHVGLDALVSFLLAGGVLAWPWRAPSAESHRLRLLGALIFGTSLVLLFWYLGLWRTGFQGGTPQIRLLMLSLRLVLGGGLILFLLAERPARARGPLGWLLGAQVVVAGVVVLLAAYLGSDPWHVSPVFGLALLSPLAQVQAGLCPGPPEPAGNPPEGARMLFQALPYLPYLLAGLVLGLSVMHVESGLAWPILGFVLVTGLLVLRQFLLLQAVARANLELEAKVEERTRHLEELQHLLLRTERMNTLALLGAGISHDLNNLLTAVRGSAELVLGDLEAGATPDLEDVRRIHLASGRAGDLARRVMAYAREEGGEPRVLDVNQEMEGLRATLELLLPRGIDLVMQPTEHSACILAQRHELEQILVNLVGNARDAMPKGGSVTLRVRQGEGAVQIQVVDTGQGMSEAVQTRLFEPFFTTKGVGRGTGLGLASVQALMNQVGGSLSVASRVGEGTTFTLTFPQVEGAPAP